MKNYLKHSISFLFGLLILSSFSWSCKKDDEPKITITTTQVNNIDNSTAKSGGTITNTTTKTIMVSGICWGTAPNPTIAGNSKTIDGTTTGTFSSTLSNLNPNTTYYVRAYATDSDDVTHYGNMVDFKTTIF